MYERTVRSLFEMINFSNCFIMVSDRGEHPMSESCCGSSVYVSSKVTQVEHEKTESWKRLLQQYTF